MITPQNSPEVYRTLPEKIKLEILKEEFLRVYEQEQELDERVVQTGYDKTNYFGAFRISNGLIDLKQKLISSYYALWHLFDIFQLSEESKTQIYYWAKTKRKEFKLNDNLFNAFTYDFEEKYNNINEKLNKQNNI